MYSSLKEINRISIYTKSDAERIQEIALVLPMKRGIKLPSLSGHSWQTLSFPRRATLKIQTFFFRNVGFLVPPHRRSPEAKFSTILAALLVDPAACSYFLGNEERRLYFSQAAAELADYLGYSDFEPIEGGNSERIAAELTTISRKNESLIKNPSELRLQLAALHPHEKNDLIFRFLNALKRPPVTSVVEVSQGEDHFHIPLTTKFAKYKIDSWNRETDEVRYSYAENEATASIRTIENIQPGATGVVNQREICDARTHARIGTYGGELSTREHLFEQILLILNQKSGRNRFLPKETEAESMKILFTSLYSWNELGTITEQHGAIHTLNGQVLELDDGTPIRLCLFHYNVALGKVPPPAEMGATIKDINDECLLLLLGKTVPEEDFFERQKKLIVLIDQFRRDRSEYVASLAENSPLRPLVANQRLKGLDQLIYLNHVAEELGFFHNKNSTMRSFRGAALDKALHAYQILQKERFLPLHASDEQRTFFQVLHHLYNSLVSAQHSWLS